MPGQTSACIAYHVCLKGGGEGRGGIQVLWERGKGEREGRNSARVENEWLYNQG